MSQLQFQVQGHNFDQKNNSSYAKPISAKVNGSGGYKIPQEKIDQRRTNDTLQINHLQSDTPSQNELYAALGLFNQVNSASSQGGQPSFNEDNIQQKIKVLRVNREQTIAKKQQLIQDRSVIDIGLLKNPSLRQEMLAATTSDDLDLIIDQHRRNMKPLEEKFLKQRANSSEKILQRIEESIEFSDKQQGQEQRINAKVTYHSQKQTKPPKHYQSVDKMKVLFFHKYNIFQRVQEEYNGKHGEFLKNIMPSHKIREIRSQSVRVKEEDFQLKFKQYIRQKNSNKGSNQIDKSQLEFDLYQSTSPNPIRRKVKNTVPIHFSDSDHSLSNSKIKKNPRYQSRSKSPYDEEVFLIEHIFNDMNHKSPGKLDKISTIKYLMQNPQILDAFDIEPVNLNRLVNQAKTKEQGSFNKAEFNKFLRSQRKDQNMGHTQFGSISKVSISAQGQSCLLNKDQINILRKVFDDLDTTGDSVVLRMKLMQQMRNEMGVIRILHVEASYIPKLNKVMTLDKVLSLIEQSYDQVYDKDPVRYISWQQFMEFFNCESGNQGVSKSQLAYSHLQSQTIDNVDDQEHIDASSELVDLVRDQFESLDKYEQNYALTIEITDAIRRHPLYSQHRKEICRIQAKKFNREQETLEDILTRIEDEAQEYLSLPELLSYFSRRGAPKQELRDEPMLNSLTNTSRQDIQNQKQKNQNEVIDGYDSDPEIHTYQDKLHPRQRLNHSSSVRNHITYSHHNQKSQIQQMDNNGTSQSFYVSSTNLRKQDFLAQIQPNSKGSRQRSAQYVHSITRPQPYAATERDKITRSKSIRQIKLQQMVDEKKDLEDSHIKQQFKSKPIPKHVKEARYEKIMSDNQSRSKQIKQESKILTQQNERPFSFYKREQEPKTSRRRKNNAERDRFVFKAKEIPWHVHVDLWQKIQEEENSIRKERIAKHAQQLAMSSKMPERMERHERMKLAQTLVEDKQQQNQIHSTIKAKKLPDFDKLHSEFQNKLDRKKSQMRTTQAQPFNFHKSMHGAIMDHMDQENINMKAAMTQPLLDPIEIAKRNLNRQPKYQPSSTKKFQANLEKLRNNREEQKLKEEKLVQEEILRQERKEQFRSRVQNCKTLQSNSETLKAKTLKRKNDFKKQQRDQEEQFKNWKAERLHNAQIQPLLVDRPTKRDLQLEKMKTLHKMKKILDKNQVKDKEQYFNEDEQNMLKDIEYLKKQGYGEDFDAESGHEE